MGEKEKKKKKEKKVIDVRDADQIRKEVKKMPKIDQGEEDNG